MASLERELEGVVGHIRALVEGQRAAAEEANKIVQNELIEVKKELIEAKDEAQREMSVLDADKRELQAELERSAKRIDILTTEISQAEAKAEKAEAKAETAKAEAEKAEEECVNLRLELEKAKVQIDELQKAMDGAKVMREEGAVGAEVMRKEDADGAVDADETQIPGSPESVQSPVLGYTPGRNPGEQDNEEMETGVAGGAHDGGSQTESEDEALSSPPSPLREGSHNIQVAVPEAGSADVLTAEAAIVISDDDSQSPSSRLVPEKPTEEKREAGGGASAKQSPSSRLVPEKPTGQKRKPDGEASAKQSPGKKPRFDYPTRAMKRHFEAFEEDCSNPQKWNKFQHLFLKTFHELDVAWGALQIQKGWDENTTDEVFVKANKRMTRFKKHADKMKDLGYKYSGSGEDQFMQMTKKGDSEGSVVVYLMHECARFIHDGRDFKEK